MPVLEHIGQTVPRYTPQPLPPQDLDSNVWYLPVVGMIREPGKFSGGSPQWASGSFGTTKTAAKGGHIHQGVDIYANAGAEIISPVNGRVKSIGSGGDAGNFVKIQGDDGREYYFAHMESVHPGLSQGGRVNAGGFLGGVGNTGNASGTSTHLHFEVREGGKSVSPNEFLNAGTPRDTTPLSAIAGLSSVGELQAYIDEQVRAAQFMQGQGPLGFDPSGFNAAQQISSEDAQLAQTRAGQTMLGQTLNAMSSTLSGGSRTPLARVSSAMDAVEGGAPVPTAADQRVNVQEEPDATR